MSSLPTTLPIPTEEVTLTLPWRDMFILNLARDLAALRCEMTRDDATAEPKYRREARESLEAIRRVQEHVKAAVR